MAASGEQLDAEDEDGNGEEEESHVTEAGLNFLHTVPSLVMSGVFIVVTVIVMQIIQDPKTGKLFDALGGAVGAAAQLLLSLPGLAVLFLKFGVTSAAGLFVLTKLIEAVYTHRAETRRLRNDTLNKWIEKHGDATIEELAAAKREIFDKKKTAQSEESGPLDKETVRKAVDFVFTKPGRGLINFLKEGAHVSKSMYSMMDGGCPFSNITIGNGPPGDLSPLFDRDGTVKLVQAMYEDGGRNFIHCDTLNALHILKQQIQKDEQITFEKIVQDNSLSKPIRDTLKAISLAHTDKSPTEFIKHLVETHGDPWDESIKKATVSNTIDLLFTSEEDKTKCYAAGPACNDVDGRRVLQTMSMIDDGESNGKHNSIFERVSTMISSKESRNYENSKSYKRMLETESNQIHIKVAVSLHKIVVSYIRGMGRIFRISTALKSVPSLPKHMWLNARKGETIIEFNVGCAPPQGWPSQYGFKPNNVEHALSAATNGQFTEDGVQFYIDPDLMKECLRHKDKWGNVNVGGVIIEELDKEQIQIPDGADAEMRINIFRTQAQREQDNELAASANTAYKNYFEHIPIPQD